MKKLIKDQGIKPGKVATYLSAKKKPSHHKLEIKKELTRIKDIIKKARKV